MFDHLVSPLFGRGPWPFGHLRYHEQNPFLLADTHCYDLTRRDRLYRLEWSQDQAR